MSGPRGGTKHRVCIGFGKHEGRCFAAPDFKLNRSGLWCTRCEQLRRRHISGQMKRIEREFERSG